MHTLYEYWNTSLLRNKLSCVCLEKICQRYTTLCKLGNNICYKVNSSCDSSSHKLCHCFRNESSAGMSSWTLRALQCTSHMIYRKQLSLSLSLLRYRVYCQAGGGKCRNQGLCSSCCSLNTIRLIKRRTMRWAGHVTCTGRWEMHTKFWFETVNRSLGNVATDNIIIIFKYILGNYGRQMWMTVMWLRIRNGCGILWTR
jgi:hypothetical protein